MNNIGMGVAAMVTGLLGFFQRNRISQLNRGWKTRFGKPGELVAEVGTAKYFGIGAILMALTGAATVISRSSRGKLAGQMTRPLRS